MCSESKCRLVLPGARPVSTPPGWLAGILITRPSFGYTKLLGCPRKKAPTSTYLALVNLLNAPKRVNCSRARVDASLQSAALLSFRTTLYQIPKSRFLLQLLPIARCLRTQHTTHTSIHLQRRHHGQSYAARRGRAQQGAPGRRIPRSTFVPTPPKSVRTTPRAKC